MQKCALFVRYAAVVLLTVLVAQVYCAAALPHAQAPQTTPDRAAFLRFGQSLAFADFDGDDRIDKATLGGNGRSKEIEIRLSYTAARTVLHFDTLTSERGSLLTSDVDNDGDSDLIWSDLLHPESVVIWLDNGSGRFDRVCPDQYAQAFVLSDAPAFGGYEIPHQDCASGPRHDQSFVLLSTHKGIHSARAPAFSREYQQRPVHSGVLRTSLDRGPPSLV